MILQNPVLKRAFIESKSTIKELTTLQVTAMKAFITAILGIIALGFSAPARGQPTSATRHLPPWFEPNVPFTVTIEIHMSSSDCGAALIERIPDRWPVRNIRGDGAGYWNTNLSSVIWAPIDGPLCAGAADHVLSYEVIPPPDATNCVTFAGEFSVDGVGYGIIADARICPAPQTNAASRILPLRYTPTLPVNVAINVTLQPDVCQAEVIEAPPTGWALGNVNANGTLQDGRIVWILNGPSCAGATVYALTYTATPPQGETGTKVFEGLLAVNGSTNEILGHQEIVAQPPPLPDQATRTLPESYSPEISMLVHLVTTFTPNACGAVLAENPPAGWVVNDIQGPGGGMFVNGRITWTFSGPGCGGQSVYEISYTVTPPITARGTAEFTGILSVDGSSYPVIGDALLPVADADSDGVPDIFDQCPGTAAGAIVDAQGCSIEQLVPASAPWKSHGDYVSAITEVSTEFVRAGLINVEQRNTLVNEAARSNIGKKH